MIARMMISTLIPIIIVKSNYSQIHFTPSPYFVEKNTQIPIRLQDKLLHPYTLIYENN